MNPGEKSRCTTFGPRLVICHDPAAPNAIASSITAGSTPERWQKTSASAIARLLRTTAIWLQSFTVCPAPLSPQWVMRLPIVSRTGRTRSRASAVPPHMIESVPLIAPCSPPEIGASMNATSRSASRAAIWRVTAGEIVDMSITTEPGRMRSMIPGVPGWPKTTASTSSEARTQITIVLARLATSAGDSPRSAPASAARSIFEAVRFQATTG